VIVTPTPAERQCRWWGQRDDPRYVRIMPGRPGFTLCDRCWGRLELGKRPTPCLCGECAEPRPQLPPFPPYDSYSHSLPLSGPELVEGVARRVQARKRARAKR
jgi:hypothetical protein